MSEVVDITPEHNPLSIIREAEREILESGDIAAAFVVLIDNEGHIWRRGAAFQQMELLWALERTRKDLMDGLDD